MKIAATLLLLALAGDGDAAVGRAFAAFRAGRAEEALAEFQAAVRARGDAAPAELHFDVALAALQCNQPALAEAAAEQAVARGGEQGEKFVARRAFVRGSAAFHAGELFAAEAALPDADPTAFDRAIRSVEQARDAWTAAATSRADWPQARRNVERAVRKLDELARAKAERQRKRAPPPGPPPPPPPDQAEVTAEAAPPPSLAPDVDLTPSQIERLLEILRRDEEEKRAQRRARRAARPAATPSERDW